MSLCLLGLFFLLSLVGVPLAIALGLSVISTLYFYGLPLHVVSRFMYSSMNSFLLVAVPLFVLAGLIMEKGGIASRIFSAANSYVGRWRGALGHVNIIASFIFGGISGSSVADVGSLGPIEIKAMTEEGYPRPYAAAMTMITSTLSSIVPPSILMVIASVVAEQSVSACLAGGIGPAVLLSLLFMLTNYIIARRNGYGKVVIRSYREIAKIIFDAIPALLSPLIILSGIFCGFVTPTEAAGLAVVYTLFLSIYVYKGLTWKQFPRLMITAGVTSGTILLIAMVASVATYIFAIDQLPDKVSVFLLSISTNSLVVLLIMGLIFIVIGMFLDITAAILLLTPVLMPTALVIGINPIHFVVFMVMALSVGLSTPPVGVCLFATSLVSKLKIETIVKASWPFYVIIAIFLVIFAAIPQIATSLVDLMLY